MYLRPAQSHHHSIKPTSFPASPSRSRRAALPLQLRASVCVGLVVVLRLLNLAVPILYKKVVDEFAYASAVTHPQSGEPRTFSFHEVGAKLAWLAAGLPADCMALASNSCRPAVPARLVLPPACLPARNPPSTYMRHALTHQTHPPAGVHAMGAGLHDCLLLPGRQRRRGGGLISNLRSYLWIPISQNSYRCASGQGGQACPLACAWVIAVRPPLVPIPLRKFHTYSCAFPSCLYFLLSVPLPPPGGRL